MSDQSVSGWSSRRRHAGDLWAVAFATCFLVAGCGFAARVDPATSPGQPGDRLKIVATTGLVADLVREIVGDAAEVTSLMGPGADPHLYKPTRNDVRRLLDADVIIYTGLGLEHRMQETIEQIGRSGRRVFAVTDGLDRTALRAIGVGSGQYDPHVWMDVRLWSECTSATATALSDIAPEHADAWTQRTEAYRGRLTELDRYIAETIATIPADRRVLVTAHDAFGYFAARYGLEVHSVQGVSTDSEAGVQDINALVSFIVERKIPALFLESSVSPKSLQAVLEGGRSRGLAVALGGTLFSDALGPTGTYEGTYLGMLDANATRIASALGGTPPSGGWQGKLTPERVGTTVEREPLTLGKPDSSTRSTLANQ